MSSNLGTASANEKLGTASAIAAEKFFLFFKKKMLTCDVR
jgi:hypothetical protein